MIENALIMAAGRGMRLNTLTEQMAKPLVKINNRPLISLSLNQLLGKIPNIGITVGYQGGDLAKYAIEYGVRYVFNTTGHGNAWWVFNTLLKLIDEPVLVLTCDNIVELDLTWIHAEYIRLGNPFCMLVPVLPVKGIEGDFIFHRNGLINKLSRDEGSEIYASGIQVLNPFRINMIFRDKFDFNILWNGLIEQEKLFCSDIYQKSWYSVNTPEQLSAAISKSNMLL